MLVRTLAEKSRTFTGLHIVQYNVAQQNFIFSMCIWNLWAVHWTNILKDEYTDKNWTLSIKIRIFCAVFYQIRASFWSHRCQHLCLTLMKKILSLIIKLTLLQYIAWHDNWIKYNTTQYCNECCKMIHLLTCVVAINPDGLTFRFSLCCRKKFHQITSAILTAIMLHAWQWLLHLASHLS